MMLPLVTEISANDTGGGCNKKVRADRKDHKENAAGM
jgi:hypothetical protein